MRFADPSQLQSGDQALSFDHPHPPRGIKILYLCASSGSRPGLRFHHSRHYLAMVSR